MRGSDAQVQSVVSYAGLYQFWGGHHFPVQTGRGPVLFALVTSGAVFSVAVLPSTKQAGAVGLVPEHVS